MWQALQAYRRVIPPQVLSWYVSDDGDFPPLDDKSWEHIRWQMLERPWGIGCLVELAESPSEAAGYNFSYDGRQLDADLYRHDEGATSAVAFAFPTEYLLERGPAHLRALALELARDLPFTFGYASLAFVSPGGLWYSARRELLPLLSRYLGMDLYREAPSSGFDSRRLHGQSASCNQWEAWLRD